MDDPRWVAVDHYVDDLLALRQPEAEEILRASDAAGLPAINVAANQGRLLELFARAIQARRVLEIGTLGGYSTWWLASALPHDGTLVTLEFDPHHCAVARANLDRAGVGHLVQIIPGPGATSLARLIENSSPPFDLVFIDADNESYAQYFTLVMELVHSGSVIVADNVVRNGAVALDAADDPRVEGVRRFLAAVAQDDRVRATAVQTVGAKGYDGFAYLVVA
ncbi:MAG: O-methyltransferase [Acidobacteriota bacterium]|nr:O-methyltransferase [Acidobacteriota bacterium]